jgi:hypothetical protein
VGLVYNPRRLLGVMTVRTGVAGVLQFIGVRVRLRYGLHDNIYSQHLSQHHIDSNLGCSTTPWKNHQVYIKMVPASCAYLNRSGTQVLLSNRIIFPFPNKMNVVSLLWYPPSSDNKYFHEVGAQKVIFCLYHVKKILSSWLYGSICSKRNFLVWTPQNTTSLLILYELNFHIRTKAKFLFLFWHLW